MGLRRLKTIFSIVAVLLTVRIFLLKTEINEKFLDVKKCPACYGSSLCNDKLLLEAEFQSVWRFALFNYLFNVRNVFYMQFDAKNYVLKKLAHSSEIEAFDKRLKDHSGQRDIEPADALQSLSDFHEGNVTKFIRSFPDLFENSEPLKCGHLQPAKLLYEAFLNIESTDVTDHNFLTLIAVNPEPLILQAFYPHFPFPKHIGSCGRVIMEEYCGESLTKFYHRPWRERAKLASQLLQLAVKMTENPIRMYLTDPSPENFAVDDRGVLRLVDVENILLVDSKLDKLVKVEHRNEGVACRDCLSYSYEDLCNHKFADHNYFAFCKGLLSRRPFTARLPNGFLHDVPDDLQYTKDHIMHLIEECSTPKKMRRGQAAKLLIFALDKLD